jgi:hypothetical protein
MTRHLIYTGDHATVTPTSLGIPMTSQPLKDQIRVLTSALSQATTADAETREMLLDLQRQIARIVEHHESPMTDRLEEMAVRFEADHPAVGTALRQAIDALSKAGI